MKKNLCILFSAISFIANAQIVTDYQGHVGIDCSSSSFSSIFNVSTNGHYNAQSAMSANTRMYTLYLTNNSTIQDWNYSLYAKSDIAPNRKTVGIVGRAYQDNIINSARAYGVIGIAGNATSGWNYGVFGGLYGSNYGSAITGSIHDAWGLNEAIGGRYAGYFNGPVYSTSNITAVNINILSDRKFKKNIRNIGQNRGLENITQLTPVEYELQRVETDTAINDTLQNAKYSSIIDDSSKSFNRNHFGLLAQDVQKVLPELVYEDECGNLSVDYIGLIPILIQSVQDLKSQIEELKKNDNRQSTSYMSVDKASLSSIIPSSSGNNVVINYYVPESSLNAKLLIYDGNGLLQDSYIITEKGESSIIAFS